MKKLVKEQLNEGFQENLHKWMDKHEINIDDKDQRENVYSLCIALYDSEQELHDRTPLKGVSRF